MKQIIFSFFIFFISCSYPRIKHYESLLDNKIGVADKEAISKLLGSPVFCDKNMALERCEYRTSAGRTEIVPEVVKKTETWPDLSPYDYYDVIHLFYDDKGILRDWKAIVLKE